MVGVNVATYGNHVGFLGPARHIRALIEEAASPATRARPPLERLREQLLANQEAYIVVTELRFAAELKPLPLSLTRQDSLEHFLADVESLRARVDAEARVAPAAR